MDRGAHGSTWPDVDSQRSSAADDSDNGDGSRSLRVSPFVQIMSALARMPILMAATLMSSLTDRSCKEGSSLLM